MKIIHLLVVFAVLFTVGCAGSDGTSGRDGQPGAAGAAGISATEKGDKGDPGAPAAEGPAGPQGPAGSGSGSPGPAGATGAMGTIGVAGVAGAQGAAGAMGLKGDPGASGPAGPAGPAGSSGAGFTEADLYTVNSAGFVVPSGGKATAVAYCLDNNDIALNGACSTQNGANPNFGNRPFLYASGVTNQPDPLNPSGWSCSAEYNPASGAGVVFASVVCLKVQ